MFLRASGSQAGVGATSQRIATSRLDKARTTAGQKSLKALQVFSSRSNSHCSLHSEHQISRIAAHRSDSLTGVAGVASQPYNAVPSSGRSCHGLQVFAAGTRRRPSIQTHSADRDWLRSRLLPVGLAGTRNRAALSIEALTASFQILPAALPRCESPLTSMR